MTKTMSASEAQEHFGELMRDVDERGETVLIERSGEPRAVVLPVAEYERMGGGTGEKPDWRELVRLSREGIARELNGRPLPDVTEVIHQMREERDAQILANLRGCEPRGAIDS